MEPNLNQQVNGQQKSIKKSLNKEEQKGVSPKNYKFLKLCLVVSTNPVL